MTGFYVQVERLQSRRDVSGLLGLLAPATAGLVREALIELGERAEPQLEQAAQEHPDAHARLVAGEALAELRLRRALPGHIRRLTERGDAGGLLALVDHRRMSGRVRADELIRQSLLELGERALPALIGAARAHPSTHAQLEAIAALGQLGDRRAVAVLGPLADRDPDQLATGEAYEVWQFALEALAGIDPEAALPLLLRALEARDLDAAQLAVDLLTREVGGPRALEALVDRLAREGPHDMLAHKLLDALWRLGDRRAAPALVAFHERLPDYSSLRPIVLDLLQDLDPSEARRLES